MKKILFALIAVVNLSASLFAQTETDHSKGTAQTDAFVKIRRGLPINLVVAQELSSADLAAGQAVLLKVAKSVVIDGIEVIRKGADAYAIVYEVEKTRGFGRGGRLALRVTHVRGLDESDIPIRSDKMLEKDGRNRFGRAWAWAFGGAVVGGTVSVLTMGAAGGVVAVPCLSVGFKVKGEEAIIEKETLFTAFFAENGDGNGLPHTGSQHVRNQ